MGKKVPENPKSVAAKERKENIKQEKATKEKKAKEDALWETDKHVLQKEDRKKAQDDKKAQEAERKKQARDALAREEQDLNKQYAKNLPIPKVTQAEIARRKQIEEAAAKKREEKDKKQEDEIQENMNRVIQLERIQHGENYLEARSLNEAVDTMSLSSSSSLSSDKHPEKRLKASYAAFEEKNLPATRAENPSLKLSQVKELIWKQWQKSPENPINQQS